MLKRDRHRCDFFCKDVLHTTAICWSAAGMDAAAQTKQPENDDVMKLLRRARWPYCGKTCQSVNHKRRIFISSEHRKCRWKLFWVRNITPKKKTRQSLPLTSPVKSCCEGPPNYRVREWFDKVNRREWATWTRCPSTFDLCQPHSRGKNLWLFISLSRLFNPQLLDGQFFWVNAVTHVSFEAKEISCRTMQGRLRSSGFMSLIFRSLNYWSILRRSLRMSGDLPEANIWVCIILGDLNVVLFQLARLLGDLR